MTTYDNYIGKSLKAEREKYGMDSDTLAQLLDVAPAKIRDIETGNCLPDLQLVQQMQEKLGFDISSVVEFFVIL